jgi:hypothetical protein
MLLAVCMLQTFMAAKFSKCSWPLAINTYSYRVRSTSGDGVNLGVIIPGFLVDLGGVQRGFLHIVLFGCLDEAI